MNSFTFETTPVAKKDHVCIWCGEKIETGLKHIKSVGRYEDFQSDRWHMECEKANAVWRRESGESEFEPHSTQRGSKHMGYKD